MKQGADFNKAQLDKLDNSQLLTMTREEARNIIDEISDESEAGSDLISLFDYAQSEVQNGGVTFVVIRIEG